MKKKAKKQMSFSNRIFYMFNSIFWIVIMLIILYPLYLVCIASVSDPDAIVRGQVIWHPVDFSLIGYQAVFQYKELWSSYANSIFYTFASVVISILVRLMRCQDRNSWEKELLTYSLYSPCFSTAA